MIGAHRINKKLMPELEAMEGSDFFFVGANEPEEGVRKLLAVVTSGIPARFGLDPVRDIQVLCPMNRGGLGAPALNAELQQVFGPCKSWSSQLASPSSAPNRTGRTARSASAWARL